MCVSLSTSLCPYQCLSPLVHVLISCWIWYQSLLSVSISSVSFHLSFFISSSLFIYLKFTCFCVCVSLYLTLSLPVSLTSGTCTNLLLDLISEPLNPNQTWNPPPPLDVSPNNFAEIFFPRTALSRLFSFESCATFDAIFVKIGRTVPKLRNVM